MSARMSAPSPPPARRLSRSPRRAGLLTIVLALPLALSGCALQSLGMSRHMGATSATASARPSAATSAATSPARSAAADTTAEAPLVQGALATGSMTHTLAAGDRSVVVSYWTTQDVATWSSDKNVAIQLSAHMENSDARHAVIVTRFKATLTVDNGSGAAVLRDDSGRFVMTPPYSYGSTLMMPSQPANARAATISVEFDLLIETVPGSGAYFRQTVLDTFQLVFVPRTRGTSS